MSKKNLDPHGRFRSVTVAFRVSPEESELINSLVHASGLTKQDYIIDRLTGREITVVPSTRVQKALTDEMHKVYTELVRLRAGMEMSPELVDVIETLAKTFEGLGKEEVVSEVVDRDARVARLGKRKRKAEATSS